MTNVDKKKFESRQVNSVGYIRAFHMKEASSNPDRVVASIYYVCPDVNQSTLTQHYMRWRGDSVAHPPNQLHFNKVIIKAHYFLSDPKAVLLTFFNT